MAATHTASLADALIGDCPAEFPTLTRLDALKTILECCREPEVWAVLSESDPGSTLFLMEEIDAMVRDCETVLATQAAHEEIRRDMDGMTYEQLVAVNQRLEEMGKKSRQGLN